MPREGDECLFLGLERKSSMHAQTDAIDPTATLAVHCGNGFDAGIGPYESTRLTR